MNNSNFFSISAQIELKFKDPQIRDFSYNSYLPEYKKVSTNRSKISISKEQNSLLFFIESTDITAFRASVNDIISLGKVVENTLKLCQ